MLLMPFLNHLLDSCLPTTKIKINDMAFVHLLYAQLINQELASVLLRVAKIPVRNNVSQRRVACNENLLLMGHELLAVVKDGLQGGIVAPEASVTNRKD